jgi:hypothetical protein
MTVPTQGMTVSISGYLDSENAGVALLVEVETMQFITLTCGGEGVRPHLSATFSP